MSNNNTDGPNKRINITITNKEYEDIVKMAKMHRLKPTTLINIAVGLLTDVYENNPEEFNLYAIFQDYKKVKK